jgi:hypothetical protein
MKRHTCQQQPRDVDAPGGYVNASYVARHQIAHLDQHSPVLAHDRATDRLAALARAEGPINAAPTPTCPA